LAWGRAPLAQIKGAGANINHVGEGYWLKAMKAVPVTPVLGESRPLTTKNY